MRLKHTEEYVGYSRTMCEVLDEIRKLDETRNYSPLAGLIEELQSMANRMEAALGTTKDLTKLEAEKSALKKAVKDLQKQEKALSPKKPAKKTP